MRFSRILGGIKRSAGRSRKSCVLLTKLSSVRFRLGIKSRCAQNRASFFKTLRWPDALIFTRRSASRTISSTDFLDKTDGKDCGRNVILRFSLRTTENLNARTKQSVARSRLSSKRAGQSLSKSNPTTSISRRPKISRVVRMPGERGEEGRGGAEGAKCRVISLHRATRANPRHCLSIKCRRW